VLLIAVLRIQIHSDLFSASCDVLSNRRKKKNLAFSYVSIIIQETHFWTLCSNYYCGGLKLEVSANADPKYIVRYDYVLWEGMFSQDVVCTGRDLYANMNIEKDSGQFLSLSCNYSCVNK
jgi:hypothetical protein